MLNKRKTRIRGLRPTRSLHRIRGFASRRDTQKHKISPGAPVLSLDPFGVGTRGKDYYSWWRSSQRLFPSSSQRRIWKMSAKRGKHGFLYFPHFGTALTSSYLQGSHGLQSQRGARGRARKRINVRAGGVPRRRDLVPQSHDGVIRKGSGPNILKVSKSGQLAIGQNSI